MRKLSIFLLVGIVALLAVPAEAVVESEGELKGRPVLCDNNGDVCTTPLIAGQTMIVGEVSVSRDTGELLVTYEISDPAWSITEIHFEVSNVPITESAPGQYTYVVEDLNTQFYQFVAEHHSLSDCYFAAHAVVTEVTGYVPGPVDLPWLAYNLPDQVQMKVTQPSGRASYFTTTVTDGGALNGDYDGWCIDIGNTINVNANYTANVYSSYEDLPDGINIDHPENLDLVNFVINNFSAGDTSPSGGTYTPCEIQTAIWALIDDSTAGCGGYDQTHVDEIVDAAWLSGEGFTPDCGDVIAVILVPVDGRQITIAQITIVDILVECGEIPVLGDGSETAWGCGYPIREKKNWGWYFHCGSCEP